MCSIGLSPWNIAIAILLLPQALRMLYRLTLHPLAKFPGPKLAASTNMVMAYHDLCVGGNFVKTVPALHDKYGPVVRIAPNLLHVRDIDAYDEINRIGSKFDREVIFYSSPFFTGSYTSMPQPQAKPRKDLFVSAFSRSSISKLEPLIRASIAKFVGLLRAAAKGHQLVDLSLGFRCLTADIAMEYSFQEPLGAMDAVEFKFKLITALDEYASGGLYEKYFLSALTLFAKMLELLPPDIVERLLPPIAIIQYMQRECRQRVLSLKSRLQNPTSTPTSKPTYPSVFDTALNPSAAKGQPVLTEDELTAEAMALLVGATDTTANTLVVGTWHLLNDSHARSTLEAELKGKMQHGDEAALPGQTALESLPYLKAVIKESLRLSHGAPGRIPRVTPEGGAIICGYAIPAGTIICNSASVYHLDPSTFPDPHAFRPERWLGPDAAKLERHLIAFSRGSRGCLGVNLAWTELYLTFAALFGTGLRLKVSQTTAADMVWDDYYIPITRGHLRVAVS